MTEMNQACKDLGEKGVTSAKAQRQDPSCLMVRRLVCLKPSHSEGE